MFWLKKLREFESENNLTYKQIADNTGIALTTVEKLFSGRTKDPKLNMITKIVNSLGHTPAELVSEYNPVFFLSDSEKELVSKTRKLDTEGKKRIDDTLKSELERIDAQLYMAQRRYSRIYYDFPVSAGTGEFLDNRTAVIAELSEEPPKGTDYILRIAGDSMKPIYHSGDYVYVNSCETVDYGQVGIFVSQGSVYMKEYTPAGLKSFNSEYKLIKGSSDIRCLGKVIGKLSGEIEIPHTL